MASIVDDIRQTFRRGDINVKLIGINIAVLLLMSVLEIALTLFNRSPYSLFNPFELPASVDTLLRQPWSIVTYMFMHASLMHILLNMLWLFWIGHIFLDFFSSKHLRGLYILGGMLGGALYIITYNIFPYFSDKIEYSYMLGASASVLAIVTAAAYRSPNYPIQMLLLGTFRLKYVAIGAVALDLLMVTTDNAGGHIAHIGGAASGLLFAWLLDRGTDLTAWINAIIDAVDRMLDFTRRSHRNKRPKMKVSFGGGKATASDSKTSTETEAKKRQDRIDHILDKIRQSGYQSLTEEEKKELFNANKN